MELRFSGPVTIGIAILATAAVAATAWLSREPSSPPPPGQRLYELRCSGCHDAGDMAAMVQALPDRGTARYRLETFLSTHTVSTADENRIMVDFLLLKDPG